MQIVQEKVWLQQHQSFGCFEFRSDRSDGPYHIHPEYELTQIVTGSGYRLTGDHVGYFEPGDLVLHGSNLPHLYHSWPQSQTPVHSIYMQFKLESIGILNVPECRNIRTLLDSSARGISFSESFQKGGMKLIRRLQQSRNANRVALFLELFEYLYGDPEKVTLASIGYQSSNTTRHTQRINKVITYILENYQNSIQLTHLAEIAHMQPQSLSRFFKKQLQKTIQDYITEIRISHATKELLHSDKSIVEISFEAGFSNLSNFNRLFKRRIGKTPREYRMNLMSP